MEKNYYQDIPKEFYSFETNKPFEHCIECERYLLDDAEYVVEKAVRRYDDYAAQDVLFDYAMCISCAMKMREEFSKESREKIDAYFASHVDQQQLTTDVNENDLAIDECLENCIIKDVRKDQTSEFQIYGHFKGNKLFKGIRPYMICSAAVEDILPLISNSTQDFLNGFYQKHFSPDPSLMSPVPDDTLVFI